MVQGKHKLVTLVEEQAHDNNTAYEQGALGCENNCYHYTDLPMLDYGKDHAAEEDSYELEVSNIEFLEEVSLVEHELSVDSILLFYNSWLGWLELQREGC